MILKIPDNFWNMNTPEIKDPPRTVYWIEVDGEGNQVSKENMLTGEIETTPLKNNKMREIKAHPFEIYEVQVNRWNLLKKTQRQWRWQVRAKNGEIVGASTESFVNYSDCEYNAMSTAKSINEYYS